MITQQDILTSTQVNALYQSLYNALKRALQARLRLQHVKDYYLLRTLLETGLRVSELASLDIKDLNEGNITVRNGKGNKSRCVQLTDTTVEMLQDFIKVKQSVFNESIDPSSPLFLSREGSRYHIRSIRRRVKYWFNRLKFPPNLSVHSCRHTYITALCYKGVDLPTIKNNAGHSSLQTTSLYVHLAQQGLGSLKIYG